MWYVMPNGYDEEQKKKKNPHMTPGNEVKKNMSFVFALVLQAS